MEVIDELTQSSLLQSIIKIHPTTELKSSQNILSLSVKDISFEHYLQVHKELCMVYFFLICI